MIFKYCAFHEEMKYSIEELILDISNPEYQIDYLEILSHFQLIEKFPEIFNLFHLNFACSIINSILEFKLISLKKEYNTFEFKSLKDKTNKLKTSLEKIYLQKQKEETDLEKDFWKCELEMFKDFSIDTAKQSLDQIEQTYKELGLPEEEHIYNFAGNFSRYLDQEYVKLRYAEILNKYPYGYNNYVFQEIIEQEAKVFFGEQASEIHYDVDSDMCFVMSENKELLANIYFLVYNRLIRNKLDEVRKNPIYLK